MLALARKYRPRTFASVAVQSHVSNTLRGAIARGRVAAGYLLCGPRGVGKTTLARVLAMALNCERRPERDASGMGAGEPCGECTSCVRIWSGLASLDVVELDAASNRGVDDARELRERAMYAPSGDDRYKVYIVDEAHMLTRDAWNALLKILEEPPPRVVFVFATTEPQKIAQSAAPVLSRLQRFDFKRIGQADIRARLAAVLAEEQIEAEPDALAMIARAADGSMRDALSLTDQALSLGEGALTVTRIREALGLVAEDEYVAMLDLIAERRAGDVFAAVGRLSEQGVDFGTFLTGFADMLRAQLALTLGASTVEVSEHARAALESRRGRLTPSDLLRMLAAISELEPRFRKSGQQQLLLETLLVRFALLDRSVELEEVLKGLDERGGGGAGGGSDDRLPPRPSPTARAERVGTRDAADREAPKHTGFRPEAASGDAAFGDAPRASYPRSAAAGASVADRARGGVADIAVAPSVMATPVADRVPTFPTSSSRTPIARAVATDEGAGAKALVDLNEVVERWDAIIARVRKTRIALASLLEHVMPVALTAAGALTLHLEDDAAADAIEAGREDVLSAIRADFPSIARLNLRRVPASSPAATRRLTEESVRGEKLAALRKRDPVLNAAIDVLDLELLE